jgi:hypothetical protein
VSVADSQVPADAVLRRRSEEPLESFKSLETAPDDAGSEVSKWLIRFLEERLRPSPALD